MPNNENSFSILLTFSNDVQLHCLKSSIRGYTVTSKDNIKAL